MAADKMDDTNKDPAIKLFGKKIPVPADGEDSAGRSSDESEREDSNYGDGEIEKEKADKGCLAEEANDTKQEALLVDEEKGQSPEKEITNSKEKPLKKPDKILPCPRCNSMDTKFCYYNNYNVNQPRHFCRACQRYWTAGGTMRNVPVGAGRRKTKNSSLHYTHITISEAFQAVQIDTTDGVHHPAVKSNGGVLSFGLNSPVCESMASVPCIGDKKMLNGTQNGFHKEKVMAAAGKVSENVDCCSNSTCSQEPGTGNPTSFNSPVPCLPGFWPYPCHSAESAGVFYPAGFPVQLYPAAYWNWGFSVPFLSPDSCSSQKASDPSSPKLGKHSREDCLKPGDSETEKSPKQKNGSVLIPKTLRIDDPDEAAKSSIWETLGIKNESLSGGIFRGFKSKSEGKKTCVGETSPVLLANPAALCRSMRFQESS